MNKRDLEQIELIIGEKVHEQLAVWMREVETHSKSSPETLRNHKDNAMKIADLQKAITNGFKDAYRAIDKRVKWITFTWSIGGIVSVGIVLIGMIVGTLKNIDDKLDENNIQLAKVVTELRLKD